MKKRRFLQDRIADIGSSNNELSSKTGNRFRHVNVSYIFDRVADRLLAHGELR